MQRVIVAAPQAALRGGVRKALKAAPVLEEAETRAALGRLVDAGLPDLVMLDASFLDEEVSTWIGRGAAVIVLFDRLDDLLVRTAFECGVRGLLSKGVSVEELSHAARKVMAGEQVVSADVLRRLLNRFVHEARDVHALDGTSVRLTPREWQIGELLRSGRSTQAIASELQISTVTVRRHLAKLQEKLGVSSRSAAVTLLDG
jgi:DNA-binding NarL/FixJ family response regulator